MTEADARALMAQAKFGDPPVEWGQHPSMSRTIEMSFGVTDELGRVIRGLLVDLRVHGRREVVGERFVLGLMRFDGAHTERVYQLDVSTHPGKRARGRHHWPHEHIGSLRCDGPDKWERMTLDEALEVFCDRINLTLENQISPPGFLRLR